MKQQNKKITLQHQTHCKKCIKNELENLLILNIGKHQGIGYILRNLLQDCQFNFSNGLQSFT